MPNTIKHIRQLFDEHHEIAAWVVILLASVGRGFDKLADWPTVALIALALVTLLGAARFKGVNVGPGGIGIGGGDCER